MRPQTNMLQLMLSSLAIYLLSFGCASSSDQQEDFDNFENFENFEEIGTLENYDGNNWSNNDWGGNDWGGNDWGGNNWSNNNLNGNNWDNNWNSNWNNAWNSNFENGLAGNNAYGDFDNFSYGESLNSNMDEDLFSNQNLFANNFASESINSFTDDEMLADAALNTSGTDFNNDFYAEPTLGQSANELPQPALELGIAPEPGGIVKYVISTLSLLDQPSGMAVGTLQQGDHPVVWDYGEYHKTMDGRYIPSSGLTTQPIGRPRVPGYWQ